MSSSSSSNAASTTMDTGAGGKPSSHPSAHHHHHHQADKCKNPFDGTPAVRTVEDDLFGIEFDRLRSSYNTLAANHMSTTSSSATSTATTNPLLILANTQQHRSPDSLCSSSCSSFNNTRLMNNQFYIYNHPSAAQYTPHSYQALPNPNYQRTHMKSNSFSNIIVQPTNARASRLPPGSMSPNIDVGITSYLNSKATRNNAKTSNSNLSEAASQHVPNTYITHI